MKKLHTIGLAVLMSITAITLNSCKKPEKGDKGDTGPIGVQGVPGPDAKTYTYSLTFTPSQNFQVYSGVASDFDAGDVVLTYILNNTYGTTDFYVQLPYLLTGTINVYAEVGNDGMIIINTDKANGTSGSPWVSNTTLGFKSVLIKSSANRRMQETGKTVDYSNYKAVVEAYGLNE